MKNKEHFHHYKNNKTAEVGDKCICPTCGSPFTKDYPQQTFCRKKSGTICKDGYWNTVDPNKFNSRNRKANLRKMELKLYTVTSDEIISLDSRIKYCIVENPDEESSNYYAKIWFSYKMNNRQSQDNGRQEFVTETKKQLLSEIQDFMKSDKVGWCIL